MSLIIPANSLAGGGGIDNSLRFNSGSSDSLTRTLGTPTNNKKWTYSFWVKQCNNAGNLLNTGSDTSYIYFRPSGADPAPYGFSIEQYVGSFQYRIIPNMVFRDHSAWRHIVIAFDTTQATASNRIKLYVNGEQVTSFNTATYPSLNLDTQTNSAVAHKIGGFASGGNLDSYLSAVNFIDGQQLTPTDFGEFDEDSGIWKPIAYTGTYGTNGFYLEFKDSSALGDDTSGNSNDFTVNNLTSIDQTTDTPTNNFATMNPLFAGDTNITYAEGNLKTTATSEGQKNAVSTIAVSSGKWYCEMVSRNGTNYPGFGIMDSQSVLQTSISYLGSSSDSYCMFQDGNYYNNGSASSTGTSWGVGSIMGVAIDLDSGTKTIKFYKDGAEEHSATISTPANAYVFAVSHNTNGTITEINFGNAPYTITTGNADANGFGNFEYEVPAGYYALNTNNLAEFG
jgi:hypothetical protein